MKLCRCACTAFMLLGSAVGCGGGDDGQPGYLPSTAYANMCAAPRPGTVDKQGTLTDEKLFLRSWIDETYLWYTEVPPNDPAKYDAVLEYFGVLKTPALTPTGHPKDRFHFTYTTAQWDKLSTSAISAGYGVTWAVVDPAPPRRVVAAYTDDDTPATDVGIGRGDEVVTIDGEPVVDGDKDILNAGLFPDDVNETHILEIRKAFTGQMKTFTLVTEDVQSAPVRNIKTFSGGDGKTVGYFMFTDHTASAEEALLDAIGQLAGVTDLIIDMRYNGGGYIVIAAELAYMIAGPRSSRQIFDRYIYNSKFPVGGVQPFQPTTVGLSVPAGNALPSLDLARVFILTGPGTCSASESVMNGLRGIGVDVIQIGSTTCGKPYGFVPEDNCGITYFAIQFQGANAKGFADYPDGFVPGGSDATGLPGCAVPDDFSHALADPHEARLNTALVYQATGACPAPTGLAARMKAARDLSAVDGEVVKPLWLTNQIVIDRRAQ